VLGRYIVEESVGREGGRAYGVLEQEISIESNFSLRKLKF